MIGFLVSALVLVLIAVGWILALWFVFTPDFAKFSPDHILLIHLVPPLLAWLGWEVLLMVRKRLKKQAADDQAKKIVAESKAKRQAAQQRYDAELAERAFACHCRYLAIHGIASQPLKAAFAVDTECDINDIDPETIVADESPHASVSARLLVTLNNLLTTLYQNLPAARVFPVYLVAPQKTAYRDEFENIRVSISETMKNLALPKLGTELAPDGVPALLALPDGTTPADRVLSIFETERDLAGIIVLALDSPRGRSFSVSGDDELDNEALVSLYPNGNPGEAIAAFCFTNSSLIELVDKVNAQYPDSALDNYDTTHSSWKNNAKPEGNLRLLAALTPKERTSLTDAKLLCAVHRAAAKQISPSLRPLQRTQLCQELIESNLIATGIQKPEFDTDVPAAEAPLPSAVSASAPTLAWLAYNASINDLQEAAEQIAPLGAALNHFEIDLNIVQQASNVAAQCGDWGVVTPWAMLATAILHTECKQLPSLCATFNGREEIALNMLMPVVSQSTG